MLATEATEEMVSLFAGTNHTTTAVALTRASAPTETGMAVATATMMEWAVVAETSGISSEALNLTTTEIWTASRWACRVNGDA